MNTKTLSFSGASDDLFCYAVDGKATDEQGCYNQHSVYTVSAGGEKVQVVGLYAPKRTNGGCWMVGLKQWDEDIALPNWNFRYEWEGYTVVLKMDVPEDFVVTGERENDDD